MRYKTALIGCGYWGQILLRNLLAHDGFSVAAICDRNSENRAKAQAHVPQAIIVASPESFFDDPAIQVLVIAVQANGHGELVNRALLRGKHVFVEKPFVTSGKSAEAHARLAREKGRIVLVDHTFLFAPEYLAMKRAIEIGAIGKVLHIHSTRADFGLFQADVGILLHLFYHDAYMFLDLMKNGRLESAQASSSVHIVPGLEDVLNFHGRFESGETVTSYVSMLFPEKYRHLSVTGTDGILFWEDAPRKRLGLYHRHAMLNESGRRVIHSGSGEPTLLEASGEPAVCAIVKHFHDCLEGISPPICDAARAVEVVKFVEQVAEIARRRDRF